MNVKCLTTGWALRNVQDQDQAMRILQCVTCEERCMGLLTVKVVAGKEEEPQNRCGCGRWTTGGTCPNCGMPFSKCGCSDVAPVVAGA